MGEQGSARPTDLPHPWRRAAVAGHDVFWHMPDRRHEAGFVVLYLHGVHQRMPWAFPEFVRPFTERGLPMVCPVSGPSWWVDRIVETFDERLTPEQFVVDQVLPWIEKELGAAPPRIALLGTSMGGQGALRLSYKHPRLFPVVAALAPAIDFHLKWREGDPILRAIYPTEEAARQDTALLYAYGLNCTPHQFFSCDPDDRRWWESADRLRMKLQALGCAFTCDLETRAGGHGFAYYTAMAPRAAAFIEERLEQKRRSLL